MVFVCYPDISLLLKVKYFSSSMTRILSTKDLVDNFLAPFIIIGSRFSGTNGVFTFLKYFIPFVFIYRQQLYDLQQRFLTGA